MPRPALRHFQSVGSRYGPGRVHAVFYEDRNDPLDQTWWPMCNPGRALAGWFIPKRTRVSLTCRRCARVLGVTLATERNDMADDVGDFLNEARGSRYPAATFAKVGDSVVGVIVGTPKVVDTQYGKRLLVDLENAAYAEGGQTVWIKAGPMGQAVAEAVGGHGLAEGGKLMIVFTEERDTGKPSPLKIFEAQYEVPRAAVDPASVFDSLGQG
jgi:hypothetical protein